MLKQFCETENGTRKQEAWIDSRKLDWKEIIIPYVFPSHLLCVKQIAKPWTFLMSNLQAALIEGLAISYAWDSHIVPYIL